MLAFVPLVKGPPAPFLLFSLLPLLSSFLLSLFFAPPTPTPHHLRSTLLLFFSDFCVCCSLFHQPMDQNQTLMDEVVVDEVVVVVVDEVVRGPGG